MKLATIRTAAGTAVVASTPAGDKAGVATEVGSSSLEAFLALPDWQQRANRAAGSTHRIEELDFAPLVTRPEKIFCVGLNYGTHIKEMGRDLPEHPTLFSKFARSLIGAYDDIQIPKETSCLDWEAELALVIGAEVRSATPAEAEAAIAGYTVLNDITARDYQTRTLQWLQGKTFEATTPIGPWLVTDADVSDSSITCVVDGDTKQSSTIADLVFDAPSLVQYISNIITLVPGDVIATGTPGGVGHAMSPQQYLSDGSMVVTTIDGLGACKNQCVAL